MERKMFLIVAALVLLFVQSAFAQSEELSDTVWTKFTYPNAVNAVKFTPDGKYLASGGDDGVPRLWDAETGALIREFQGNDCKIWSLDINNSGELIAVVNDSSIITIWNVNSGEILKVIDYYGNSNKLRGLDLKFSNNGIYLAAILAKYGLNSIERDIILWNTHNWEIKSQLMDVAVPISLMFSPDDSKIAVSDIVLGDEKIVVAILNVPSLSHIAYSGESKNAIIDLAFSPNNEYLAGALESSPNKIWNTSDWKLLRNLGIGTDARAVAFSPDSKYVVTGYIVGGIDLARLFIFDKESGIVQYSYLLDYFKDSLFKKNGLLAYSIDINKTAEKIAVGTGAGICMLNAKWNPTSVQDNPVQIFEPIVFPNPTNSTANIRFDLLNSASINIQIYDINSRLIAHIFDGYLDAGNHNFEWNTAQTPSGSYFARITTNGIVSSIQIIVNK